MDILTAWDIGPVQTSVDLHLGNVFRVERAAGAPVILKNIGKDTPQVAARFAFEYEVLCHLDRCGVAVALPVPNRKGEFLVAKDGHLFTVSPYLTSHNQWLELDFEGLRRLNHNCGAAIGKLHTALAAFPTAGLEHRTWKTVLPDMLFDHSIPVIQRSVTQPERDAFDTIIADIATDLRATTEHLPTQLIHRDCHHGNIVVDGEQVSGFIDCDHLSLGPRVFDLADFIVHMIKQDVGNPERTAAWFGLFPAVIQGYEKETPLSKEEKRALYYVMVGVLLMLAGWFFETGDAAKARSELGAIRWMHYHRQEILEQIMSPDRTL